MTSPAPSAATPSDVLARLKATSSAEDFFGLLGVHYEAGVLNVARLHILKRMGQYLGAEDLDGLPDTIVADRCKAVLQRAYDDFAASSPLEQRVFKVLKQAVAPKRPPFVPFDELLKPR